MKKTLALLLMTSGFLITTMIACGDAGNDIANFTKKLHIGNSSSNNNNNNNSNSTGTQVLAAADIGVPVSQATMFAGVNASRTSAIMNVMTKLAIPEQEYKPSVTEPVVVQGYYTQTIIPQTEAQITNRIRNGRQNSLNAIASGQSVINSLSAGERGGALSDLHTHYNNLAAMNTTFLSAVDQMIHETNMVVFAALINALGGN